MLADMGGCIDYGKLCMANGTVVKDCKLPILALPSPSQASPGDCSVLTNFRF